MFGREAGAARATEATLSDSKKTSAREIMRRKLRDIRPSLGGSLFLAGPALPGARLLRRIVVRRWHVLARHDRFDGFHLVGVGGGNIVLLRGVGREIVEL